MRSPARARAVLVVQLCLVVALVVIGVSLLIGCGGGGGNGTGEVTCRDLKNGDAPDDFVQTLVDRLDDVSATPAEKEFRITTALDVACGSVTNDPDALVAEDALAIARDETFDEFENTQP